MDATREIYWNVGHGAILPMYLLTFATLALLAWGIWRRLQIYRQGRPLQRLDQSGERVKRMVRNLLTQRSVRRGAIAGIFHSFFFWGFALLFIGTLLIMLQVDLMQPLFNIAFLQGNFYRGYSLILDLAGLLALIMLTSLLMRRFFLRPPGLETIRDDYLIHGLLFAILLSGFVIEGARMAATELPLNPDLALWSPVGRIVGLALLNFSAAQLATLHVGLWWLHLLLALGLIAAIPFTKLRHIFTTSTNYLFVDLSPKGTIATINLEDESLEQFGAARIQDLSWKDIFDADACTSCKRCQDRCPAYATEKPLSPMKVVQQIGEVAEAGGGGSELVPVIGEDVLWACTTCFACQDICPAEIEHVNKILEMRRNLALMEGSFPGDEVRTAISHLEVNGNPFGLAFAARGDWAEGLEVTILGSGEPFDLLYFVGCFASFDRRNQEVARNFVKICTAAGIRVGILGRQEKCCGEPARKLGNEYLYQMHAAENIATIKGYEVKQIVTACPHCFNTLGRDYRDLGLEIPVEHYTTFIARLLDEERLPLVAEPFTATYHDSCYIGRYMDIYDQPRQILQAAGGTLTEMDCSHAESFCCGAGGGRILAEEKIGSRINVARIQMAQATGAPLLISNCPFCLTMFEDGIKTGDAEEVLQVKDLAEIVAERIVS